VELAQYYHDHHNWLSCRNAASQALGIAEKPLDYLCEAEAWGWLPHDLMAIASYRLGDKTTAWHHGGEAVRLNVNDDRLRENLKWYNIWA
jgi:hypothetical protein